jgi:hypothetical protein
VHAVYTYDDPQIAVSSMSGVIDGPGRPFTHGFELHFENATVHHEFAAFSDEAETMPVKVVTRDGQVLRPRLPAADEIDAFVAEIDDMAKSVTDRKPAARLDGHRASNAIQLALDIQRQLIGTSK